MDKISDLKQIVINTLDVNKAQDIISIDLKDKSSMADYMIKFYYGDPDVYDPGDEPDELIALRTLQATSGAVLDKVGINHMYLQLAERSIRDKPVFDPDNLNSKLNKLKLFLDNRE